MKYVILCDFDGTITAEETFVAVLKRFAPEIAAQIIPQMYEQQLTLRQGVRRILEIIPSSCYPEILDYVRVQPIRPGLVELLNWLQAQSVPFVVVSGGLRGMVEEVLGSLGDWIHAIHAVDVDLSQSHLQVYSEFEEGTELVSKVKVMVQYPADTVIAIGDSVTDLNLALHASITFARDRLADYLDQQQKPYIPWNDFFDVRDHLAELWK